MSTDSGDIVSAPLKAITVSYWPSSPPQIDSFLQVIGQEGGIFQSLHPETDPYTHQIATNNSTRSFSYRCSQSTSEERVKEVTIALMFTLNLPLHLPIKYITVTRSVMPLYG